MKIVFALLALFLLTPQLTRADEFGVTPGVGIGRVKLGDSLTVVHKRLGNPVAAFSRQADGTRTELWTKSRPATLFSVPRTMVIFQKGRVRQIEIAVSTRRTLGQIAKTHPRLRVARFVYDDFVYSYYDDVRAGVTYAIGAQDYVSRAFTPTAVIVHPHGVPVLPAPGGKIDRSEPHLFEK